MNNKGQAVMAEYVMIFFVTIAALTGMTTLIQRSLQARIHEGRNFLIASVANSSVCDVNCLAATGGSIAYEYEPYYSQVVSDVAHNGQENAVATKGSPQAIGAIYLKSLNDRVQTVTNSVQLSPGCADGASPRPSYCPS
ncbi:MAG: hypothetical protein HQL12_04965 [Candidatus Omnitrophica bacterium]|nr:hypothetical protein [Candidatus Omnitrophota bacterium]